MVPGKVERPVDAGVVKGIFRRAMRRPTEGQTAGGTARRLIAALAFLCVWSAIGLSAQCPDGTPPPCRTQRARSAPAANSVAVLYFENLSPDTADAYLADGLTEEMIARLGGIDRLIVKSRTAVQRFRGRTAGDPAALGRTLGVAHLVSGSVRRAGTRLRVTVELLRATSGTRVWGEQYDRTDADLLAIEADIATAVATAIAGRLLPHQRASLALRPTGNPQAYDLYLQGNHDLAQRNPRAVARAIREFEAAARLDSTFARALARAAFGYGYFAAGWNYPGLPYDSVMARGNAAVNRALRWDSTSSDAWLARGFLLAIQAHSSLDSVQRAFDRAITLNPKDDEAWHYYGVILFGLENDSAAEVAYQHALAIEPLRPVTLTRLGELEWARRHYLKARRSLDSAIALDPEFYFAYWDRSMVRLHLGDVEAAQADAESALRLSSGDPAPETVLALVDVRAGDSVSARARLQRFWLAGRDTLSPSAGDAVNVGWVLVALGEGERAIDLLERVRGWTVISWSWLRFPEFDAVRSSPRFQGLFAAARPVVAQ